MEKEMAKIFLLAMKLQDETDYGVFINFSGHVNSFEIHLTKSKEEFNEKIAECEVYTHREPLKRLIEVKEKLTSFAKAKEIDVSELDYYVEEIRHYYF